jgi:hypothetical protein
MRRLATAALAGLFIFSVTLAMGEALCWALVGLLNGGRATMAVGSFVALFAAALAGWLVARLTWRNDLPGVVSASPEGSEDSG